MATRQIDFTKEKKLVRAAVKSGKRTVTLGGKLMRIERITRLVSFEKGDGTVIKRKEHWLFVSPADGSQLPCMMIEPNDKDNLRS